MYTIQFFTGDHSVMNTQYNFLSRNKFYLLFWWKLLLLTVHHIFWLKRYYITLLTNLKEKKSVFTFQIQNILSKALQLQGHKCRCVQFATCVKYFIFNASCESHRPAFMTLEPIRWRCKFAETLRNDKYFEVQQQHKA